MTVEVTKLEARKETVEATLDGKVIVRAMRVDAESTGYLEHFAPNSRPPDQHWMIYLPGAHSIVGHEIPALHHFGSDMHPLIIEGLAKLIAKAATA